MIEEQGEFTDILWQSGMNTNNGSNLLDIILMIAWCIWKNKNEGMGEENTLLQKCLRQP